MVVWRSESPAMGSSVGTGRRANETSAQDEMHAYFATKKVYEDLSPEERQQDTKLLALGRLYREVSEGGYNVRDSVGGDGSGGAPRSEVALLLALDEDEKEQLGKTIVAAAIRNATTKQRDRRHTGDYGRSFGGTKKDTQAENEFAILFRGPEKIDSEELPSLLKPVECESAEELAKLRAAGKWLRYLGPQGCYMWIHVLTKEVTALRPMDYEESHPSVANEEDLGTAGEFPRCTLSALPDVMKAIIDNAKKTPLFIDTSEGDMVSRFFLYKAVLVDVSVLCIGYQKSGTKVSDVLETIRMKAVAATKSGATLVLRLGHLTSEHANFNTKLCARNVFPAEMFQEGGKKMFTPQRKPRCNLMFREVDMDQGQCLVKPDGFRFCAITSLEPHQVLTKLGDTLPLGYMQPIAVSA